MKKGFSQEELTFPHGANSATHSGDNVLNSDRLKHFFRLYSRLGGYKGLFHIKKNTCGFDNGTHKSVKLIQNQSSLFGQFRLPQNNSIKVVS